MVRYAILPSVQDAYRNALGIADAPAFVDTDTPITPVAIIAQATTASIAQFTKLTDGTDTLLINTDGSLPLSTCSTANANRGSNGTTTILTAGANGAVIYGINLGITADATGGSCILVNGIPMTTLNAGASYVVQGAGNSRFNPGILITVGQIVAICVWGWSVGTFYGSCQYKQL